MDNRSRRIAKGSSRFDLDLEFITDVYLGGHMVYGFIYTAHKELLMAGFSPHPHHRYGFCGWWCWPTKATAAAAAATVVKKWTQVMQSLNRIELWP